VGCFGLTEPDAGSDPASMRTRCRKVGDEYVITGVKRWITSGSRADVAIVWAKDEGSGEVLGFVVETDRDGFSAVDIKTKASMRASVTSELYLDEVVVPAANRLDVVGMRGPLSCLNQARFGIAFGVMGAAQACFEEAVAYTSDRVAFGVPLASKQIVQERLADMLSEITKGSLLAYRLGRLKEEGQDHPTRVSLAKRDNCRSALAVARAARGLLGGNGIRIEYAAIRHMLNLETVATYEGTDTVYTLVLGRHITGINAFRTVPPGPPAEGGGTRSGARRDLGTREGEAVAPAPVRFGGTGAAWRRRSGHTGPLGLVSHVHAARHERLQLGRRGRPGAEVEAVVLELEDVPLA